MVAWKWPISSIGAQCPHLITQVIMAVNGLISTMMETHGSLRRYVSLVSRVGRSAKAQHAFINQGNGVLSMKLKQGEWSTKASPGLVVLQIMTTMVTRIVWLPITMIKFTPFYAQWWNRTFYRTCAQRAPWMLLFAFQSLWADFDNNGYLDFPDYRSG